MQDSLRTNLNLFRGWPARLNLGRFFIFMTEQEIEDGIVEYFSKWFDVHFQVKSLSGKSRIDVIMYHNSDIARDYPIGIEIKKTQKKRGTMIGDWCVQARRYTNELFHEKKATIFIYPQITGDYLKEGDFVSQHDHLSGGFYAAHNNVNPFLYKCFEIGELQKYGIKRNKVRLAINSYVIWESENPNFLDIVRLNKL
ncbi:hypothetical protein UFOVP198_23 [uncultured Caudovirales phage]|uniref:Uncharacterized protein n=1 Tax=uncultured Caudovirales phage TaxID=2100421 RepID=A0A6J7WL87_9CAUD|nr:hypothetical protein UFOVP198_23 [uncultured Caudovirales phage]